MYTPPLKLREDDAWFLLPLFTDVSHVHKFNFEFLYGGEGTR